MKRNMLRVCLIMSILLTAILVSSATAQEPEDEFIFLPIVLKAPTPPPDCNSYEPNDTPGQANWIRDSETQTQCIIPETDQDWVKFSVTTESRVLLEAADEGGDLELNMYDSDLGLIERSYSGPDYPARVNRDCGIGRDPLLAGTYYASFEHWLNWDEIPSYDIALSINPCPTLVVLPNHSYYTTGYALYVVGEVQNNGQIGTSSNRVIANLFDGEGQLVDTSIDYVWEDILPGDKTCFSLSFSDWAGWSYYQFETPTYNSTSNEHLENMTVYDDYGTYSPSDGSYSILGFVRNDNDFRVESVGVTATPYNASGTVVGCGYTYVSSTDLDPGQSSSFEMRFSGYNRDYADVAAYRVQVDGYVQ